MGQRIKAKAINGIVKDGPEVLPQLASVHIILVKEVLNGASNAALSAKLFIEEKMWSVNGNSFQNKWMTYGLESEADAIKKYEQQTKVAVTTSGLWVNPKFPFLACSPDGLISEDGVLEIK